MSLLQKVIDIKLGLGCIDRYDALQDIRRSIDKIGPYEFAKMFRVLVENSSEDFMIEFMTAYNTEVAYHY